MPFSDWCEDLREYCGQTIGIKYKSGVEVGPGELICGEQQEDYWLVLSATQDTVFIYCENIEEVYAQT